MVPSFSKGKNKIPSLKLLNISIQKFPELIHNPEVVVHVEEN